MNASKTDGHSRRPACRRVMLNTAKRCVRAAAAPKNERMCFFLERNINELVAQMTLEEKAGLCSGADFWHLKGVERLGIPGVMVSDGPHGLRKQDQEADHLGINDSIKAVCFPAACATAASFDEALLERMGRALGEECRAEDVSVLLGPAVNIKRSPLCGRNFEYFSEDPYLAGKLAAAQVRGVQSWDVGTSVKHYAANNQEYRRMTCSSDMSERTLREIYLAPFETIVKEARPWTLMCSYNKINGVFASENPHTLTEILRDEWGFDGYVMSDWGAVNDRVKGLAAGLELEMPSSNGVRDAQIVAAVRGGTLEEAVLDKAVARILNIVFRYADVQHPEAKFDRAAHHALAAELEKECAVLLQNKGALPLARAAKIAYIGGFAEKPRYQGGGSSHINASAVASALDAARVNGTDVVYAEGFPADRDETDEAKFAAAVEAARAADAAIIFAGLPDSFESEGYDRSHMRLPECQDRLIARVAAVQPNTVVVLHNGSPVECPWAESVNAVLEMYLGGQGVGAAADALLYGDANPSGRLPETFPYQLEDNPSHLNFPGDGKNVEYAEGVFVGYRYYDKKKMAVRWPFGHGLSYTTFEYSNVRVSADVLNDGGTVTVYADIKNTGDRAGREVVQLYVADRTGTAGRPEKELKGFSKVALEPGETKTVELSVDARSLSWYSEALGGWYAAPGRYELLVGHSSRDIRGAAAVEFRTEKLLPFHVDENTTVGELLADPRTASSVRQMARQFMDTIAPAAEDSADAAKEAVSDEMARQMMDNMPLRGLRSFGAFPEGALERMIADLNAKMAQ